MKVYCSLKIKVKNNIQSVNKLMGINSHESFTNLWILDIEAGEEKSYWDVLETFIDLINTKYNELNAENIVKEDITIWLICEYMDQCNLEFNPSLLERIGNLGITLCISCYQQ